MKTLKEKAKEVGINYTTIRSRIYILNWNEEKALSTPARKRHCIKSGEQFGRLTVIGMVGRNKWSMALFKCRCSCGNETIVIASNLNSGTTQSCGCLQKENIIKAKTTHGLRHHPLYDIWKAMFRRCYNVNSKDYKDYGMRGIFVCRRWRDIAKFIKDVGKKLKGTSMDRVNNDGSYGPWNFRWATAIQQANNKRS